MCLHCIHIDLGVRLLFIIIVLGFGASYTYDQSGKNQWADWIGSYWVGGWVVRVVPGCSLVE